MAARAARERPINKPPWAAHKNNAPGFAGGYLLIPSSVQYQDTLHQVTSYFAGQGSSLLQAQRQAIAWIGQQVQAQASLFAYMDVFWVLMLFALAAGTLAFALRKVKLGDGAPAGH